MQNIDQKIELMHAQDPCCPLCEQNLSTARRKFLKQKFIKLKEFNTHQCNRLALVVKKLKPILVEQHETLQKLKKQREEKKLVIAQEALIHEEMVLCKEALLLAKKELTHAQKEKEVLEQKKQLLEQELLIKQKNYGQSCAENRELATLNAQLLRLQQEEQKFALYAREMQKLQEQLSSVDLHLSLSSNTQLSQDKEILSHTIQATCNKMRTIKQRLNELEKEINEKKQASEQLIQVEKQMNENTEEQKKTDS